MSDISDDDLKKFISENKDRLIQYMRTQGIEMVDATRKGVKEGVGKVNEMAEDIKHDVDSEIDCMRNNTKEFVNAFTSEEVQRHLVKSGMEFMMAVSTIIDAIPKPGFVSKAYDKASDIKSNINREYCANNDDCPRRAEKTKRIEID